MKLPDFRYEKGIWKKGYRIVAGVDEVGRGCFAGPVVAGCVVFPKNIQIPPRVSINDSKKLTPRQREKSGVWIKENSLAWGIGESPASLINRVGMAKATKRAFRKAITGTRRRLGQPIDYLLADAFFVPFVPGLPAKRKGRQKAIIDGDEKSLTIAAASIIAKVYRDKIMLSLSRQSKYKSYGWGRNKGYGTKEHQRAIKKYGITRYHRKVFVKNLLLL
ncbi:MAG: ribonuclease HII [Patescibacteria group bacterium]